MQNVKEQKVCKRTKDFDIGDNVAPTDRGKGDVSRVPTVVVLKRGQVQACRFGTIASFYTASSLISLPSTSRHS